jgi:hypothetical protein
VIRGRRLCRSAGIASQPLLPGQAGVGTLRTGKDNRLFFGAKLRRRRGLYVHTLTAQQFSTGSPLLSARPVPPEQCLGASLAGMEQHAHLAGFARLVTVPLTLLTQGTGTTICDPGGVDDAQTASWFFAPSAPERAPYPLDSAPFHRAGGQRLLPQSAQPSKIHQPQAARSPAAQFWRTRAPV